MDDKAFTILKHIVEDKKDNLVFYTKILDEEKIETSDGHFVLELSNLTSRARAEWKHSFESLNICGFIKSIDRKNEIYEVTSSGYALYDLKK